jgi:hypothetical protein
MHVSTKLSAEFLWSFDVDKFSDIAVKTKNMTQARNLKSTSIVPCVETMVRDFLR